MKCDYHLFNQNFARILFVTNDTGYYDMLQCVNSKIKNTYVGDASWIVVCL